jgi:hypothetical protein
VTSDHVISNHGPRPRSLIIMAAFIVSTLDSQSKFLKTRLLLLYCLEPVADCIRLDNCSAIVNWLARPESRTIPKKSRVPSVVGYCQLEKW